MLDRNGDLAHGHLPSHFCLDLFHLKEKIQTSKTQTNNSHLGTITHWLFGYRTTLTDFPYHRCYNEKKCSERWTVFSKKCQGHGEDVVWGTLFEEHTVLQIHKVTVTVSINLVLTSHLKLFWRENALLCHTCISNPHKIKEAQLPIFQMKSACEKQAKAFKNNLGELRECINS